MPGNNIENRIARLESAVPSQKKPRVIFIDSLDDVPPWGYVIPTLGAVYRKNGENTEQLKIRSAALVRTGVTTIVPAIYKEGQGE